MQTLKKWVSIIFLVLLGSITFSSGIFAQEITRTTLQVPSLSCGSCLARIGGGLRGVEGVLDMQANLMEKLVIVDHDPILDSNMIAEAVTAIGYPASVVATENIAGKAASGPGVNDPRIPAAGPEKSDVNREGQIRTTYQVSNLSCGSCLARISDELSELDPATRVRGDIRRGVIAVEHPKSLEAEKIADAMTSMGYPAVMVSSQVLTGNETDTLSAADPNAAGGCSSAGGCGKSCGASSSSWQKLYYKYFGNNKVQ